MYKHTDIYSFTRGNSLEVLFIPSMRNIDFSLGFLVDREKLNKYIKGYHLSDNNGLTDSNDSFSSKSWFFQYLKKNLNYYTIEVYNKSFKELKKQKRIIEDNLKN